MLQVPSGCEISPGKEGTDQRTDRSRRRCLAAIRSQLFADGYQLTALVVRAVSRQLLGSFPSELRNLLVRRSRTSPPAAGSRPRAAAHTPRTYPCSPRAAPARPARRSTRPRSRAAISAPYPHDSESSYATITRPVFFTLANTVSRSHGESVRRSITSTSMPRSATSCRGHERALDRGAVGHDRHLRSLLQRPSPCRTES